MSSTSSQQIIFENHKKNGEHVVNKMATSFENHCTPETSSTLFGHFFTYSRIFQTTANEDDITRVLIRTRKSTKKFGWTHDTNPHHTRETWRTTLEKRCRWSCRERETRTLSSSVSLFPFQLVVRIRTGRSMNRRVQRYMLVVLVKYEHKYE